MKKEEEYDAEKENCIDEGYSKLSPRNSEKVEKVGEHSSE